MASVMSRLTRMADKEIQLVQNLEGDAAVVGSQSLVSG